MTHANPIGTRLPTTLNMSVSANSSKQVAKLSARLVSDPAKLSW